MFPTNLSEVLSIIFVLFSGIGLFLSLWIIIPAPTFSLLPLGVGAPEISPWLIWLNAIALLLTISQFRVGVLYDIALIANLLGLVLSSLPLIQLSSEAKLITLIRRKLNLSLIINNKGFLSTSLILTHRI